MSQIKIIGKYKNQQNPKDRKVKVELKFASDKIQSGKEIVVNRQLSRTKRLFDLLPRVVLSFKSSL